MECYATPWIAFGNFLFLFPLSLIVCAILLPVAVTSKARDSKRVIKCPLALALPAPCGGNFFFWDEHILRRCPNFFSARSIQSVLR